jgi:maltose O-acetyltransferase
MTPTTTQKQKMLAGELYLADDSELRGARERAQLLTAEFNAIAVSESDPARTVLRKLLGGLGEGSAVRANFRCDYGFNISIGERCFLNFDCILLDCNRITIGNEVQLAPAVHLYTATHPLDASQRRAGFESALPISIEDGVWLGGGVIVCPGVTIGKNTVVGAGSVVTKDLPPNVVAVGNPCRVMRHL